MYSNPESVQFVKIKRPSVSVAWKFRKSGTGSDFVLVIKIMPPQNRSLGTSKREIDTMELKTRFILRRKQYFKTSDEIISDGSMVFISDECSR
ncbi:hypothetical protein AVEN_62903-1 [Araneus ventricosus]|uniref:Uncharacterized protein n=1 Tax=Araneus ventricosus TaxID=182803 RepID=A0A4Y2R2K3_ARAVE|nr:hypothetical protein AVEN_62903-1 [Araneus ventricosus]